MLVKFPRLVQKGWKLRTPRIKTTHQRNDQHINNTSFINSSKHPNTETNQGLIFDVLIDNCAGLTCWSVDKMTVFMNSTRRCVGTPKLLFHRHGVGDLNNFWGLEFWKDVAVFHRWTFSVVTKKY